MNRTKLYLTTEKSCKTIAKLLVDEDYCVRVGKEQKAGRSRVSWFVEYWKE